MFRGSVKGSGYTPHSLVSHLIPFRCVTVCHHISTGVSPILQLARWVLGPVWKGAENLTRTWVHTTNSPARSGLLYEYAIPPAKRL